MKNAVCCFLLFFCCGVAHADSGTLAQQVLAETNVARQNPQRYAQYIREFKRSFIGKGYRLPGSLDVVMTSEGKGALDEAVRFLARQRPLPALSWSPELAKAADELVREQTASGETGHGERGDMKKRIEKYGSWRSSIGENISYGPDTARQVVMGLIIDDGVPDRGHRKNVFDRSFTTAGIACGPHPLYRTICVTDFAGGFKGR
ncbi:CAP domain-containing protein [Geomonas subterranea]|uniref:CAP domain-containing protein n=1 Tax=Geomonas subterranea TaxID=2847989 RepID=A0ABX8LJI8_9BACT|nr:CAP domain-containing protein [Geomonas subterranea]QXE91051.1 CAP domain-containing protein [Geomonas subterranea]QXM10863.1 CAP domain-containing protein [Geomonas subterranea]